MAKEARAFIGRTQVFTVDGTVAFAAFAVLEDGIQYAEEFPCAQPLPGALPQQLWS